MPSNVPIIKTDRIAKAKAEAQRFASGTNAANLKNNWMGIPRMAIVFIKFTRKPHRSAKWTDLDQAFDLTNNGNSEIVFQWFLHVIRNEYKPAYAKLEAFLLHGR